ncbi:NUDIX domain-containing protein [Candidatus Entotheonella palauensis]|uniref:ADP-ribose pyrophosphatase n=1 Tax=Candidatus Entotheonella gemina TaxID=1429439 RepID=W4M3P9_9BACT|nr:NUDIX domain-containing protein [Candidatus Entotheonella palauensis]ETX04795.1 MAG: ADP-ribose pyrophosphatase [Candidatus Entotheonella gemina]
MQEPQYEILETSTGYAGFFHILRYRLRHRLFNGGWSRVLTRELFERGHAAAVLPYDPQTDRVVLTEQFRIGALQAPGGPWLLEIVAGMIEAGETPEDVVRREALEEIGCAVSDLVSICDYHVSPGGTSERIHLFCGRVDASQAGGVHGAADEDEDIRVVVMPADDAIAHLQAGKIVSAAPIIVLQWLMMNRASLREDWRKTGRNS